MSHLKTEAYIRRQIPETWDEILAADDSGMVGLGFSDLGFGPREIAQLAGISHPERIPRSVEQWQSLAMGVIAASDVEVQENLESPKDPYGLYNGF